MQRFVVEPILFAIFGELLYLQGPVEFIMPYSSITELYELRDTDQIVTDPTQNDLAKQNLEKIIAYFEQPFVKKKIDRTLRVPWQKSSPILFSDSVTLTVVHALDNAEYGEAFDPIETELLLLARREKAPLITDQIEFQMRVVEAKLPVTLLDVDDFSFAAEEAGPAGLLPGEDDEHPAHAREALHAYETQEAPPKRNPMLTWVMGGLVVILLASLYTLLR